MSLRLVRLPSGAWALVAAPDAQRLETERRAAQVVREARRVPFLAPLTAAGGAR